MFVLFGSLVDTHCIRDMVQLEPDIPKKYSPQIHLDQWELDDYTRVNLAAKSYKSRSLRPVNVILAVE